MADDPEEIPDHVKKIKTDYVDWIGNNADLLEHTTGRVVFSCSKKDLLKEIKKIEKLKPCSNEDLIAAMTIIPNEAKESLATFIQQ